METDEYTDEERIGQPPFEKELTLQEKYTKETGLQPAVKGFIDGVWKWYFTNEYVKWLETRHEILSGYYGDVCKENEELNRRLE